MTLSSLLFSEHTNRNECEHTALNGYSDAAGKIFHYTDLKEHEKKESSFEAADLCFIKRPSPEAEL